MIEKRSFVYAPSQEPLTYIYTDDDLIIVEKPSSLLSVPGKTEPDCLEARIRKDFPESLTVHRLDMATSGIMVFARNANAQRHIGLQFEKRMTRKTYVARVWGVPEEKSGTVDLPLIVDWPNRPLQKVCHETGKPAQTDWKVIRTDGETSRIRLFPKTGRSHQLRVHMLALGHPILGDPFYATGPARDFPRLMLHSEELRFNHPQGGTSTKVRAKAPF